VLRGQALLSTIEHTYAIPKLGIENDMAWVINIEYAARMNGYKEAMQRQVSADVEVALTTPGGLPPKAVITAMLTSSQATETQRVTAALRLRALDRKRMDALALGLMHQNVTDRYYPAVRTYPAAQDLWTYMRLTYSSHGLVSTRVERTRRNSCRTNRRKRIYADYDTLMRTTRVRD